LVNHIAQRVMIEGMQVNLFGFLKNPAHKIGDLSDADPPSRLAKVGSSARVLEPRLGNMEAAWNLDEWHCVCRGLKAPDEGKLFDLGVSLVSCDDASLCS